MSKYQPSGRTGREMNCLFNTYCLDSDGDQVMVTVLVDKDAAMKVAERAATNKGKKAAFGPVIAKVVTKK